MDKKQVHIRRVHNKEKNFMCSECGKAFSDSVTMKQHVASVHRGERPYKCDICNKSFSAKSYLTIHKKKVHDKINGIDVIYKHIL